MRATGFICVTGILTALIAPAPGHAQAQLTSAHRAHLVLKLLPEEAQEDATIILRNGEDEEVFREGSGPFLCVSDTSAAGRISMICHHRILEARLRFERALGTETGLRGAAFRERLCNEVEGSQLDVPAGSMEVTASLASDESGVYEDEMTVYHLLWVPGGTAATLGVSDEDPGNGRPFLHQANTCGAHVMWSETIAAR